MNRNKILIILLALGIAVSAYLTYVHYAPGALFCPETGIINCVAVVTSSYSVIFGIPLALYSLVWFALAILFTQYKKTKPISGVWLLIGIGGIAYSLFSMYMLGKVCIYCSALDVLIVASIALFFRQKS